VEGFMLCRDDATNCKGSFWLSLPFFLVMIDPWWPEPNLDTYSSRMRFFSFELETEVDRLALQMGIVELEK
jgi:hypothetical protein